MHAASRHSRREQGGYVLPLFASILTVLLGFAGVGVDVWNWYHNAQRLQRAADAGALAGVVFMPGSPSQADSTARAAVGANGYTTASQVDVSPVTGRPSQLQVEIEDTVQNHFLNFLGIEETTISRDAVGEFQGPVPMGSPVNQLGNDPFGNQSDATVAPRFWLNVAAPDATTQSGDRHQARNCSSAADNCSGGLNQDYEPQGHFFVIDVRSVQPGQPLRIQAYDPGFFYVGDRCNDNLFNAGDSRLTTLATTYGITDASQRYVRGNTQYCTGDQDINGRDIDTTYIVRAPDDTPYSNTDNPVLCTKRFEDRNGNTDVLYSQLTSSTPTTPEGMLFRQYFRQWVDLCVDSTPEVGEYVVQVRTNAPASDPGTYDTTISTGGHNRFSLRAGYGSSAAPAAVNGGGVGLFAHGRLPIYVNQNDGSVSTEFYLARVEPLAANRTLELNFFDIGDVSGGTVTLTVLPPPEATRGGVPMTSFAGCRFTPKGYAGENLPACSRAGMGSSTAPPFQGRITQVLIPIPSDYECNAASFQTGCWLRVRMEMSSSTASPNDTTTWSANILGDPVRLVE